MKWKVSYKIILLTSLLTILILLMIKDNKITNLYSWKTKNVNDKELLNIIKSKEIDNLYQNLYYVNSKNIDINNINKLSKKVNLYHLTGDPSWGKDITTTNIKNEIKYIKELNNKLDYKIKGIVFDIEPYINLDNKDFSEEEFKLYVDIIKKAYKMMKQNNLELVICIPYWFDNININLLEELIKSSDKIEIMNYDINNTLLNIKEELNLSKKYYKKISTIYEINFNDANKFNNYESIIKDYNKINKYYNYNNLELSYHHFDEMK